MPNHGELSRDHFVDRWAGLLARQACDCCNSDEMVRAMAERLLRTLWDYMTIGSDMTDVESLNRCWKDVSK